MHGSLLRLIGLYTRKPTPGSLGMKKKYTLEPDANLSWDTMNTYTNGNYSQMYFLAVKSLQETHQYIGRTCEMPNA